MDGTFKKVPNGFLQLYSVHGLIDGHFRPFLFALMTRKSKEFYERLLQMIRSIAPRLNPSTVTIDFEMAMIVALKNLYPGKF